MVRLPISATGSDRQREGTAIARVLARLRDWCENHAARGRLRRCVLLDRRFLEDIGLTAAELEIVMRAPFWTAPRRPGDSVCRRIKPSA